MKKLVILACLAIAMTIFTIGVGNAFAGAVPAAGCDPINGKVNTAIVDGKTSGSGTTVYNALCK